MCQSRYVFWVIEKSHLDIHRRSGHRSHRIRDEQDLQTVVEDSVLVGAGIVFRFLDSDSDTVGETGREVAAAARFFLEDNEKKDKEKKTQYGAEPSPTSIGSGELGRSVWLSLYLATLGRGQLFALVELGVLQEWIMLGHGTEKRKMAEKWSC